MALDDNFFDSNTVHIVSRPTGFEVDDQDVLWKDSDYYDTERDNDDDDCSPVTGEDGIINPPTTKDILHQRRRRTFRYNGQQMYGSTHISNNNRDYCTRVVISNDVTELPAEAFSDWVALEHVLLEYPSQLEHIGDHAFYGCSNLTGLVYHDDDENGQEHDELPGTLTTIGDGAFCNCIKLRKLSLPIQSSRLQSIGRMAFAGCEQLEVMDLPNSVERLGGMAFFRCESLHRIRLSEQLVELEERTFLRCSSLTDMVVPMSVQIMGPAVFGECYRLQRIRLPAKIERLEDNLFDHCTELITIDHHDVEGSYVQMSSSSIEEHTTDSVTDNIVPATTSHDGSASVEYLGRTMGTSTATNSWANKRCGRSDITASTTTTITSAAQSRTSPWDENCFRLPPYIKMIGNETFAGCYKLYSIILPPSLQSIGNFCFDGCHQLVEISLPESTRHVGDGCFRDCTRLETFKLAFDSDVVFGSAAFSGCSSMKELFDPRNESIVYI